MKDSFTVIGQAEQRLPDAARQFGVGGAGGGEAALEVANTDRIDLRIMPLDAIDRVLGQFDRRDLFCGKCGRQFDSGLEAPLRFGQVVLPVCSSMNGADDAQFGQARQEQWLYSGGPVMLSGHLL